ncbi:MAG: hypothetical protein FJ012_07900 [Chloroflexi bacterium]|nr:hypothetical protein [Chloroflexota bacterium]
MKGIAIIGTLVEFDTDKCELRVIGDEGQMAECNYKPKTSRSSLNTGIHQDDLVASLGLRVWAALIDGVCVSIEVIESEES